MRFLLISLIFTISSGCGLPHLKEKDCSKSQDGKYRKHNGHLQKCTSNMGKYDVVNAKPRSWHNVTASCKEDFQITVRDGRYLNCVNSDGEIYHGPENFGNNTEDSIVDTNFGQFAFCEEKHKGKWLKFSVEEFGDAKGESYSKDFPTKRHYFFQCNPRKIISAPSDGGRFYNCGGKVNVSHDRSEISCVSAKPPEYRVLETARLQYEEEVYAACQDQGDGWRLPDYAEAVALAESGSVAAEAEELWILTSPKKFDKAGNFDELWLQNLKSTSFGLWSRYWRMSNYTLICVR